MRTTNPRSAPTNLRLLILIAIVQWYENAIVQKNNNLRSWVILL